MFIFLNKVIFLCKNFLNFKGKVGKIWKIKISPQNVAQNSLVFRLMAGFRIYKKKSGSAQHPDLLSHWGAVYS